MVSGTFFALFLLSLTAYIHCQRYDPKYGVSVGTLSTLDKGVSGTGYIVNDKTFLIRNFRYDGSAPDAYFWVGKTEKPDVNGLISSVVSKPGILTETKGDDLYVIIPDNITMAEIKSLSVWCKEYTVDFGHLTIGTVKIPKPLSIKTFPPKSAYDVSASEITIKDTKTILVKNFRYSGAAPDAFFLVGKGLVSSTGTKVPLKGQQVKPLRRFNGEDVELVLPDEMTVFDIAYLSVYCVQYKENFGHIVFPAPETIIVPPHTSLNLVGSTVPPPPEKIQSCKELKEGKMNVYWKMTNSNVKITLEGKVAEMKYLSFGISGSKDQSEMIGGDVVITYVKNGQIITDDYYLSRKSACSGSEGVCLDSIKGGSNNVVVSESQYKDGILKVSYMRDLSTSDEYDKPFEANGQTSVIAAIGGVSTNGLPLFHDDFYNKETIKIDFSKSDSSCKPLQRSTGDKEKIVGWAPSKIEGEKVFRVQLGPKGGKKGYEAITGLPGWGISFYVNGLLLPELYVKRGTEYTFLVETGDEIDSPHYHPVYVTTSKEGGTGARGTGPEKKIIAGVKKAENGTLIPTAGRRCSWKVKSGRENDWQNAKSFKEFQKYLELNCVEGRLGSFTWIPDGTVPDLVYYQCWVHKNLGWKIHVSASSTLQSFSAMIISLFVALKLLI